MYIKCAVGGLRVCVYIYVLLCIYILKVGSCALHSAYNTVVKHTHTKYISYIYGSICEDIFPFILKRISLCAMSAKTFMEKVSR